MFESKSKPIEGPGTVVGANVRLSGILSDINDINIHGQVEGEVISEKTVIVAKTAFVKGPIHAKVLSVAGKVQGDIACSEKVEIVESGEISGSITTNDLVIKSGAIFNGKCKMKSNITEKNNDNNTKQEEKNIQKEPVKSTKDFFDKKINENDKNKKYELE